MKKLISLVTLAACTLSSVHADEVETPSSERQVVPAPQLVAQTSTGKAALDGSSTANSYVGAYVFAGVLVAAVVIAAVLVSRSSSGGHHSHSGHSH